MQAYRQAAANSAAAAKSGATNTATSTLTGSNLITKQTGMDLEEAFKIINVKKDLSNPTSVLEEMSKVTVLGIYMCLTW